VTHTNWEGVGVTPDVASKASEALVVAYTLALKTAKPRLQDSRLEKARRDALADPSQALEKVGLAK